MNSFIIYKNAAIAFFAWLIYFRITSKRITQPIKKFIVLCSCSAFSTLVLVLLSLYVIDPLNLIISVAISSVTVTIIEKTILRYNVFYLIVSFGVSRILYIVTAFILSTMQVTIFSILDINVWIYISIFVVEFLLLFIIYRYMVRFKISLNYNNNLTSAGTAITGISLIIYSLMREDRPSDREGVLLLSGVILCGLGLYWWLKKESITNFNDKAQEIRAEELRGQIAELINNNLELEKTIHTDSKKLPAYREAVVQTIATGDKQARIKLLDALEMVQMTAVVDYANPLPTVGILLIDIILDFNKQRCHKDGIKFEVERDSFYGEIVDVVPQSQLETIVVNLLDNAFKSFSRCDGSGKYIVARFFHDRIMVEDNGAAFTDSVLADMERCKESLTPNRGEGVGLGYVTMFEITNECGASVEISQKDGIKSVTVRFDGENRLAITHYKGEEVTV